MSNDLIIKEINNVDLCDLTEEQVIELKQNIVSNINISKLNEAVTNACMNLSQVGPPSFMADAVYIATDNQKRLDIIYKLMNNFNLFKNDVKNFRKNKNNCNDNYDYIFNFLYNTKDLVKSVVEFGEFKQEEYKENMKQLEENAKRIKKLQEDKKKYLEGGNK